MNNPLLSPSFILHWRYLHIIRTYFSCDFLGLWVNIMHWWIYNAIFWQELIVTYIKIMIPDEYFHWYWYWVGFFIAYVPKGYCTDFCVVLLLQPYIPQVSIILYIKLYWVIINALFPFSVKGWISIPRKYYMVSDFPWVIYQLYRLPSFWKYLIISPIYFLYLVN